MDLPYRADSLPLGQQASPILGMTEAVDLCASAARQLRGPANVDATAKIAEEDRNPLRLAVQATRLRVCRSGVRTVTMRFLHLQRG